MQIQVTLLKGYRIHKINGAGAIPVEFWVEHPLGSSRFVPKKFLVVAFEKKGGEEYWKLGVLSELGGDLEFDPVISFNFVTGFGWLEEKAKYEFDEYDY